MIAHVGGCLCGRIRFEASGDPDWVTHCHCVFCRRQTGAVVATYAEFRRPASFTWRRGRPAAFRSSPGVRRTFCRHCGSPLTFEADHYPGEVHVLVGAFDEPERLPPRSHDHAASRIAWFDTVDDLPRFPGGRKRRALPERPDAVDPTSK